MNSIRDNIKARYFESLPLISIYAILICCLFLGYRIRIYNYIQSLYTDAQLKGFSEYLSLCLHYDSVTIFYVLVIAFIIIVLLGAFRKIKHTVLAISSIIFIFFILFSIEFFRVYETTFQTNFAGNEHLSGLSNVIDSALAEFSTEFYVLLAALSIFVITINYVSFRQGEKSDFSGAMLRHTRLFAVRALKFFFPALLIVFLFAGVITDAAIPSERFAPRFKKDQIKKYMSILHEFSMNPVYNLFGPEAPAEQAGAARVNPGADAFSFRLNTDSMLTARRYGRQESIPRHKKYNIILYFFESTPRKYYDVKINGRYVIGTWHRLEKNSLNFRNHYVNYPLSANALLSVLTSAYDLNFKEMTIQKYPDIKLRTLSEILKERGYRTCLIHTGGLGYAGQGRFLKNRKFDQIIDYNQLIKTGPYNRQVGWGVDERAMIRPGIRFVEKNRSEPFFLVFMPVNPHHPYAIPDSRFRITGEIPEDADFKKKNWLNYLNSLHYSDVSLGMLVDELEKEGLMEDTLFFLFADHGEAFYQHKMNYNHPLYIYNENVHVPFLIYNKKIFPAPLYFDGITRHIDIMPTLLDILGIPRSPEQEGVPILAPHREQCALLHTSWKDDYMGIVDGKWKYICRTGDLIEELYNLDEDPDEKNNLASRQAALVERYRAFVIKARKYKNDYYERILKR